MTKYTVITDRTIQNSAAEFLAVFAHAQKGKISYQLSDPAKDVDTPVMQKLAKTADVQHFKAEPGKIVLLHNPQLGITVQIIALVGIGNLQDLTVARWMHIVAMLCKQARQLFSTSVAISIPKIVSDTLGLEVSVRRAIEAASLSGYEFSRHKSDAAKHVIQALELYPEQKLKSNVSKLIESVALSVEGVTLARDLVNEPSSVATPSFLADLALSLDHQSDTLKSEIIGPKEMKKLGMNALLAIARGSEEEPRFIKLSYSGGGSKTICLVGKGVTFDSGGLSLKPGSGMETMKMDMAGAAAILGLFSVIAKTNPKINVVGLIAATENMPSGKAIKPGDVVKALNGKSIEIVNTDAEGRVILADALSYAGTFVKPDIIIDLATLTGACVVALGEDVAGLFSNNPALTKSLMRAASVTGEKVWELPLEESYKDSIKSHVADIRNISKTRYGGAITGALFIGEFVPENTPWVHMDIAGPAYAETDSPLTPVGGTGFGVRMLLEYLGNL